MAKNCQEQRIRHSQAKSYCIATIAKGIAAIAEVIAAIAKAIANIAKAIAAIAKAIDNTAKAILAIAKAIAAIAKAFATIAKAFATILKGTYCCYCKSYIANIALGLSLISKFLVASIAIYVYTRSQITAASDWPRLFAP